MLIKTVYAVEADGVLLDARIEGNLATETVVEIFQEISTEYTGESLTLFFFA